MIKRITRKETLDEVVGLISRRANALIEQSKHADDEEFSQHVRTRAWELEMILQDIEDNLR